MPKFHDDDYGYMAHKVTQILETGRAAVEAAYNAGRLRGRQDFLEAQEPVPEHPGAPAVEEGAAGSGCECHLTRSRFGYAVTVREGDLTLDLSPVMDLPYGHAAMVCDAIRYALTRCEFTVTLLTPPAPCDIDTKD